MIAASISTSEILSEAERGCEASWHHGDICAAPIASSAGARCDDNACLATALPTSVAFCTSASISTVLPRTGSARFAAGYLRCRYGTMQLQHGAQPHHLCALFAQLHPPHLADTLKQPVLVSLAAAAASSRASTLTLRQVDNVSREDAVPANGS